VTTELHRSNSFQPPFFAFSYGGGSCAILSFRLVNPRPHTVPPLTYPRGECLLPITSLRMRFFFAGHRVNFFPPGPYLYPFSLLSDFVSSLLPHPSPESSGYGALALPRIWVPDLYIRKSVLYLREHAWFDTGSFRLITPSVVYLPLSTPPSTLARGTAKILTESLVNRKSSFIGSACVHTIFPPVPLSHKISLVLRPWHQLILPPWLLGSYDISTLEPPCSRPCSITYCSTTTAFALTTHFSHWSTRRF